MLSPLAGSGRQGQGTKVSCVATSHMTWEHKQEHFLELEAGVTAIGLDLNESSKSMKC